MLVNVPVTDGNPDMIFSPRRLRAAFLLAGLVITASLPMGSAGSAMAQTKSVEVPAYRQLGAGETMASPGARRRRLQRQRAVARRPDPAHDDPGAIGPRLGYLSRRNAPPG